MVGYNKGVNNPMYGHAPWHKGTRTSTNWKGDNAGILAIHVWVRKYKPRSKECEICKTTEKKLFLANKNTRVNRETYNRDFNNWWWLCGKCHVIYDGTVNNLMYHRKRGERR